MGNQRKRISDSIRNEVLERDSYRCRYCGSFNGPFHMDHVYPVSKGGETTADNLVTACVKCNHEKSATIGVWPKPVGYFQKKAMAEYSEKARYDNRLFSRILTYIGIAFVIFIMLVLFDVFEKIPMDVVYVALAVGIPFILAGAVAFLTSQGKVEGN